MTQIYLVHSTDDADFAQHLATDLLAQGLNVATGDPDTNEQFAALHRAGLANQPTSKQRDDGLQLADCYVTCCVRCAPASKQLCDKSLSSVGRSVSGHQRARRVGGVGDVYPAAGQAPEQEERAADHDVAVHEGH